MKRVLLLASAMALLRWRRARFERDDRANRYGTYADSPAARDQDQA